MAAKRLPVVHVAVVGLTSSSFPGTSGTGAGKSCLCNRFVRPNRDDLCLSHSSIMTNSDFGSSVVNNDHYLYWGEKIAALEDGSVSFQIVEHTEFVEDGNLQLYSIVKPYHKRCIQQKLVSGGKMQYIHPDQLAVPDEFSNVARFPDKFTVDGYIICIDVSDDELPEPQSTQREFLGRLLPVIIGVKKAHIVVALTKFDTAKEKSIAAANEILSKCKRQATVIEVSAFEGVNVDVCFLVLAHLVDSRRPRTRILNFSVANANLRERVRRNEESFQSLLSAKITDFSLSLPVARKTLENEVEFKLLRELKGIDRVDRLIRAQLKYLKEGVIKSKTNHFLDHIRASLELFVVHLSLDDTLETCIEKIHNHDKFSAYFTDSADWKNDVQLLKQEHTTQVPFSLLREKEGTKLLHERIDVVVAPLREQVTCEKISSALQSASNLTPGSSMEEVLKELGVADQLPLISPTKAHQIFQERMSLVEQECVEDIIELLLEHPRLFTLSEEVALATVHEQLRDDRRYQRLRWVEQRRTSAIIKHIGVMKWPDKGPFAASPILDAQTLLKYGAPSQEDLARRYSLDQTDNSNTATTTDSDNQRKWGLSQNGRSFCLAILGRTAENALTLRSDFMNHMSGSGECEVRGVKYNMELTVQHGHLTSLTPSSSSSQPKGAVVVVNSEECLIWLEEVLQSLWIPRGDTPTPYRGLPLVILALDDSIADIPSQMVPDTPLCKRAKELANAVQCVLMTERPTVQPKRLVLTSVISPLLSSLLDSVASYTDFISGKLTYNPKALNVAVFTLAKDPYSPREFLSPWLHHQAVCSDGTTLFINCPLERQHSVVHLSFHSSLNILEMKGKVFAGFLCVYSPHRPASIAILRHLLSQLPKIPVLIIAMVTDASCDNHVTDEGRRLAEQHGAHFLSSNSREWGIGCTTEFFSKCWFSRFTSWQTQKFNPRGNRDRPLPQPVTTTSHSSMHDLTAGGGHEEMSSSLPPLPGPAPPHPPAADPTRPMSPSRPHSIAGLLSDMAGSLPPSLTSPPPYTSSLPRPPKNRAPKKAPAQEEQIYSDPVEMALDSQQKKATLQRRQERGATLPRTPGGSSPLSPDHAVLLHIQQSASKLHEDTSYADPKDIIKFLPNSGDPSAVFLQSPDMSPPPPPLGSPLMTNGPGPSGGEAEDLYDVVQPTKKVPPPPPQEERQSSQQQSPTIKKNYDHLVRQTSKKYDHLLQMEEEPQLPPRGQDSGEPGKWYMTNSPPSERPPVPLPDYSTTPQPEPLEYSSVPQPEPLEYSRVPSSLPQQEPPEYATVWSEGKARNQTPRPRNSGEPPAGELYAVVDKSQKSNRNKKSLTTVPIAKGNSRYADEGKPPSIPSPPNVSRGNNVPPPGDHLYAAIVPKRNRTPPPVLPKPSANGRGSPPDATTRPTMDRLRKSSRPLAVGGASQPNGPTHLASYRTRTKSSEVLNAVETSPRHYVAENSVSDDLYALPAPRKKKKPPVAPKPLSRRTPSPNPPALEISVLRSLPPRGKSFDLDDRPRVSGVSPTHHRVGGGSPAHLSPAHLRVGSPQLDRARAAGGVQLPLPDKHVLEQRLRTASDSFSRPPHQRNMVAADYGRRVGSSEDVWGGGRGGRWGVEKEEEERPEEPERRFSPAEMGLEEEPPPLPPRNYDWSDVEDNDEELFQSEDELDEPSLEDQQAIYSSLRLYQKKTNSLSGIEELYAIVNQVAREQEATQATSKDHPPPMENEGEVANVYDTLESALKQKETLKLRSGVTAAMTQSVPSGGAGPGPGPHTPPTQSALGTLSGFGKAVFSPKQLKLIKQQQKLLDKLQKKTEREAERRHRSEARRKRRDDKKGKKNKSIKEPEKQRYFGSPLEKVIESDGVPRFIKQCTQIIEEKGLKTEGIYRVSGKKDVCLELQDKYDMDVNMDVASLELCETTITSTLKAFFKLIPDPLIPNSIAFAVLDINVEGGLSEQKTKLARVLEHMPTANLSTLRYLILHLHQVQLCQDVNKMSSSNLAIVFWPTLMRPPLPDLADPSKQLCWQLMMARLIEHPGIIPEVC